MPKILLHHGTAYYVTIVYLVIVFSSFGMVQTEEVHSDNLENRVVSSETNKKLLPLFHPFLRHVKLSESMKSLLKDVRRRSTRHTLAKRMLKREFPEEVYIVKDNKLVLLKPQPENPGRYVSQVSPAGKLTPRRRSNSNPTEITTTTTVPATSLETTKLISTTSASTTPEVSSSTTVSTTTLESTKLPSTTTPVTTSMSASGPSPVFTIMSVSNLKPEDVVTVGNRPGDVFIFNNFIPIAATTSAWNNSEKDIENNNDKNQTLANAEQHLDENKLVPGKQDGIKIASPTTEKASTEGETPESYNHTTQSDVECDYAQIITKIANKIYEKLKNDDAAIKRIARHYETEAEKSKLKSILHEVEEIKELVVLKQNLKPGLACHLNGSWISEAGGMRIDISLENETAHVALAERSPKKRLLSGFLGDANWTMSGTVPFPKSGIIILTGIHRENKHVATFIGECKCCNEADVVTGNWLVGRTSRDCKDQKASQQFYSDMWNRENLHTLRQIKLGTLNRTKCNSDKIPF